MVNQYIYQDPAKLPISFLYGSDGIHGIPENFHPTVTCEEKDGVTTTTFCGTNEDLLELKFIMTSYAEHPVVEYVAYVTNKANTDSKIVRDISIFDGIFPGTNPVVTYYSGDTWDQRGFESHTEELMERLILEPNFGLPCCGVSPFFKCRLNEYEVRIALGWLGTWKALLDSRRAEDGTYHTYARIGLWSRFNISLHPGETVRTPSITLMFCDTDENVSNNQWRHWFRQHNSPKVNGVPLQPLITQAEHMPGFDEHCGITTEHQIAAIEKHVEKGDLGNLWWIDAGWYDCDNKWSLLGNWRPDPKRFPNGMGDIGKKCKELGIHFLLWFEPERVIRETELFLEHPDWILESNGAETNDFGLLNYAVPECVDWLIDHVDSIIKASGVTVYREDFNFNPGPYWIKHETQNRIGAIENAHIQGHIRFWKTLAERNPGLLFDLCASGGRRNEIETLKMSVPFHYTDIGYGVHPIKQKQFRYMNEWIPYYRSHTLNWRDENNFYRPALFNNLPDKFALVACLAPAMQFLHLDDEQGLAMKKEFMPFWEKTASLITDGDYYPLTICKKSTKDFYAEQFECPEKGIGFFRVINNVNNSKSEATFTIHADANRPIILCEHYGDGRLELTSDGKLKANLEKAQAIIQIYKF